MACDMLFAHDTSARDREQHHTATGERWIQLKRIAAAVAVVGTVSNGYFTFDFQNANPVDVTLATGGTVQVSVMNVSKTTYMTPGLFAAALYTPAAVTTPEPSSLALLATGLVAMLPMKRRRRR